MEIPIHGNGEAGQLPEDDGLEQVLLFDYSNCFNLGVPIYKFWALTPIPVAFPYLTPFILFTNLHSDSVQNFLVYCL